MKRWLAGMCVVACAAVFAAAQPVAARSAVIIPAPAKCLVQGHQMQQRLLAGGDVFILHRE